MLGQLTSHLEKQIKLDLGYLEKQTRVNFDFTPYINIIQMDQRFKCDNEIVKILGEDVGHSHRVGRPTSSCNEPPGHRGLSAEVELPCQ